MFFSLTEPRPHPDPTPTLPRPHPDPTPTPPRPHPDPTPTPPNTPRLAKSRPKRTELDRNEPQKGPVERGHVQKKSQKSSKSVKTSLDTFRQLPRRAKNSQNSSKASKTLWYVSHNTIFQPLLGGSDWTEWTEMDRSLAQWQSGRVEGGGCQERGVCKGSLHVAQLRWSGLPTSLRLYALPPSTGLWASTPRSSSRATARSWADPWPNHRRPFPHCMINYRHRVNGVGRGGGQTDFNQILTRFHGIQLKSG